MCCCLLLCIASTGCGGSKSIQETPPSELTASAEERKEPLPVTALQPPDPFDVLQIDELDMEANWLDRPVRNGLVLLRESQSKEKVRVSVADALSAQNDSPDVNELILSALGKLPTNEEADYTARIDRHVGGDL